MNSRIVTETSKRLRNIKLFIITAAKAVLCCNMNHIKAYKIVIEKFF